MGFCSSQVCMKASPVVSVLMYAPYIYHYIHMRFHYTDHRGFMHNFMPASSVLYDSLVIGPQKSPACIGLINLGTSHWIIRRKNIEHQEQ